MRLRILIGICACFLACFLPAAAQAPARKTQKSAPKEDAFFTGPPFSFNDILTRIGVIADKRLSTAIEHRGVSFAPTDDDYDKLRHAGASGEILNAIQSKAPPPPPAPRPAPKPEPPAPAGPLTLSCVPADCDIVINGKPRGRTVNGKLDLTGLPPGQVVVDFQREGFVGQQVSLTLRSGVPASSSAILKPTPATQAQVGKNLFNRVVQQFGGADAFTQASVLTAAGNASLWQAGGQRTDWQISSKLRLPDMALLEISGAKEKWWTSLNGAESKADGTRRMAGGPVALEMEKLARLYRDYQPAVLMARIAKMNLGALPMPGPAGRFHLNASGPDGTYILTIEKDGTLDDVVYQSASGLGSGLQVLYTDYAVIKKAWYPKSMTIKYTEQAQHGLELHFSTVDFGVRLTDKDFHR